MVAAAHHTMGFGLVFRIFSKSVSPKTQVLVLLEEALIAPAVICAVRIRFWDNTPGFNAYTIFPISPCS